jgi:hypothetical protein
MGWMEISTWRTDAGDSDVLTDLPGHEGRRFRCHRGSRRRSGRRHRPEGVGRPAEDHDALAELRELERGDG